MSSLSTFVDTLIPGNDQTHVRKEDLKRFAQKADAALLQLISGKLCADVKTLSVRPNDMLVLWYEPNVPSDIYEALLRWAEDTSKTTGCEVTLLPRHHYDLEVVQKTNFDPTPSANNLSGSTNASGRAKRKKAGPVRDQ